MSELIYGIKGGYELGNPDIPLDGCIWVAPLCAEIIATADHPVELEVIDYPEVRSEKEENRAIEIKLVRKSNGALVLHIFAQLWNLKERPSLVKKIIEQPSSANGDRK